MRMRTLRNDGGSALVELALTLPLLLLLLIASVELGRIAYAAIEVSNAARAVVAYSSQSRSTSGVPQPGDPDYRIIAASTDAADLASMGATLVAVPSQYCTCITGATTTTVACSTSAQNCSGTIVVYAVANTSATVSTMFHYPGIPTSFTLHGFAQMQVVQ